MTTGAVIRRSFVVALGFGLTLAAACSSFESADDETSPPATIDAGPSADGTTTTEDAPPVDCGDTSSNANHCGRCGHDCLGGACVAGRCQPLALATAPREVPWLVADATRVIWATGVPEFGDTGDVFACSKASGCPATGPTLLAASFFVGTLGSDGAKAYVTAVAAGHGVFEVGANDLVPLPALKKNGLLWLHPRNGMVFANAYYEADAAPFARSIYRASVPNGPFELVAAYLPAQPMNTAATVFTKDWVYLGVHNIPAIVAAPLTGGPFTEVVSGGNAYVWSMTADDERIYFTSGAGSPVYSCAANGQFCQPRPDLSPGDGIVGEPRAVHFAGGRLFVQTSEGELVTCDPKSCKQTVSHAAKEKAFDDRWRLSGKNIAVDEQAIYYVAREGTQEAGFTYVVKRVARD